MMYHGRTEGTQEPRSFPCGCGRTPHRRGGVHRVETRHHRELRFRTRIRIQEHREHDRDRPDTPGIRRTRQGPRGERRWGVPHTPGDNRGCTGRIHLPRDVRDQRGRRRQGCGLRGLHDPRTRPEGRRDRARKEGDRVDRREHGKDPCRRRGDHIPRKAPQDRHLPQRQEPLPQMPVRDR